MAIQVFETGHFTFNAVDLTDRVKSFALNINWEELDSTTLNDGGKERIAGLQDNSVEITFLQDFAAADVEATISPLVGATCPITARAGSGAVGADNPQWTFNALVTEWSPLTGAAGDLLEISVSWPIDGAVTRAVS